MQIKSRQDQPVLPRPLEPGPRRKSSIYRTAFLIALVAMVVFAGFARPAGQFPPARTVRPMDPSQQTENQNQQQDEQKQEQEKRRRELNLQRRKQISDETAMLVQLTTELKTEVDKTDKDTLSLTVIRKAEDIEKLAHAVRENMKVAVKN
jgi:hypothetical protein